MKIEEMKDACQRLVSCYIKEDNLNLDFTIFETDEGKENMWAVNLENLKNGTVGKSVRHEQIDAYNECVIQLENMEIDRLVKNGLMLDALFEKYNDTGWINIGIYPNSMHFEGLESVEDWYNEEYLEDK